MKSLLTILFLVCMHAWTLAQNCPCGNNVNLFVNGDFESGELSPSQTEMNVWNVNCNLEFGCYQVAGDASELGGQFSGAAHGGQKFMFIDGQDFSPNDTPQLVWSQTTQCMIPGQNYSFKFWIRGCSGFGDIFVLDAKVTANGVTTWLNPNTLINSMMNNPNVPLDWHQYSFNWTATSETATFSLEQISFSSSSMDFGLDDIRLMGKSTMELELSGSATDIPCSDNPGEILVAPQNGVSPFNYDLIDPNGVIQQLTIDGNGTFDIDIPGTYTVEVTDAGNCQSQIEIDVLQSALQANLLVTEPTCANTGSAALIPTEGQQPFELSVNGNAQPNTEIEINEGAYALELSDANGCTMDTTLTFTIINPVVAEFTAALDDAVLNTENQSLNANSYHWSINGGEWMEVEHITSFELNAPAVYEIELWAVDSVTGCSDSTTKTIELQNEFALFVPNCITADGDGLNEYFFVEGEMEKLKSFECQIYDRWGEMIYSTKDPAAPWTGEVYEGTYYAQDGVYTYLLRYEMKDQPGILETSGHLTVLR